MYGTSILTKWIGIFRRRKLLEDSLRKMRMGHFKAPELQIVEGVEGTWHYHLRRDGAEAALCGNTRVMPTQIPLSYWGQKADHIPESYCKECDAKKGDEASDE